MYQTKIEERNRGTKEKTNQNHRRPPSPNPTKLSSLAAAKSPCSHRRSHERRRTSLSQHILPSPARHHLSPFLSLWLHFFFSSFVVLIWKQDATINERNHEPMETNRKMLEIAPKQ
jgi:hypothetical protein